ncbi:glycosyltransferase [Kibdelosporangium persicum]|uniref:UDP-glucose--sterol glucosyltransferase n=1 Tax=Kibdelosporangium persicum TaxID=2698649 RepID=A0ABX2F0Q5_9PSEU|nr:glycosyltransferase [Kibdelosporangium persicum]NRN64884.1 UDP-glucose--sterol glucosyltransferase [Kibdelosporangium persicum]
MKIVIITIGSRGDVVPYTGLAARLLADGHDVAIATQAAFGDVVKDCGAEFRLMPGDMRADLQSETGLAWQRQGTGLKGIRTSIEMGIRLMDEVGRGVRQVADGAELLMLQRGALIHGYLVAKAMGIRSVALELFPGAPSREFMLPSLGGKSLGGWLNHALPRALTHLPTPMERHIKSFCADLGLPRTSLGGLRREMFDSDFPIRHGYSPALLPRPHDWRPGIETDGYWWPLPPQDWKPAADLVDFLAAGPPPVFIGFGSMAPGESDRLSAIVTEVVRRTGIRAVVQAGWAGLAATGDDVLTIDSVPHDWLFPQTSAVVHHCGAGTTGAGLRAGVPVVPVPVLADQPFWAARLAAIGVSPGSVLMRELAVEPLAGLLTKAPRHADRAQVIGEQVRAEDGAGKIVEFVRSMA